MKKYIKIVTSVLLLAAIVAMQADLSVFALSENNQVSEANAETAENADAENQVTDENLDADAEVEPEADQPTTYTKLSPFSTPGVAIFDGEDLSAVNNKYYSINDLSNNARTLSVQGTFDGGASVTNRKIVITVAPGLELASAIGMKKVNGAWVFDASLLPADKQGIISNATFTADAPIYGFQSGSGQLVYEISPGTTTIGVEAMVKLQREFAINVNKRVLDDLLNVQVVSDVNGTTTVHEDETFESLEIGSTFRIQPMGRKSYFVEQGASVDLDYGMNGRVGGDISGGVGTGGLLFKSLEMTLLIPKPLVVNNVFMAGVSTNMTYTLDTTSNANNTIINLKFSEYCTNNSSLRINVTVPSDVAADTAISVGPTSGSYKAIPYGSDTVISGALAADNNTVNVVAPFTNELSTGDTASTVAYNAADITSADGVALGNFNVGNRSSQTATNQSIKVVFDDTAIQVKRVRLLVGPNTPATNIVITTNNRTITIPSRSASGGFEGTTSYVNLTMVDLGYPDEYIKEITYDATNFVSRAGINAYNNYYYQGNMNFGYYGNIVDPNVSTFVSTVTTTNDGDFNGANANTATHTGTIAAGNAFGPSISNNLANQTKMAGETVAVSSAIDTTYKTMLTTTMAQSKKGFDIYLREDQYFIIDPSSISIVDAENGLTYSAANGDFIPVATTDNTGNTVYKISLPYLKVGGYRNNGTYTTAPVLKYDMTVRKDIPTVAYNLSNLLQVIPHSGDAQSNTAAQNNVAINKYNVDGSGVTSKLVGTMNTTQVVYLQAQKDFTVTSAANLNNGPWVSYDYSTNQSIIDLNPEGAAKYQLTVANNSGNVIEGYTALIPIPKAGEKTDLTPATPAQFDPSVHLQKEAFTWTASIDQPVIPSGTLGYTVLYATTYETDKDSAAFVPWSAVANKDDIRMVKVTTTTSIPDGFNESFSFPLVLSDPDADANAGNVNIYSARIHRVIAGAAGYKPSEPIAIRLKTGVVKGQVFNDANRNGLKDTGETGRNGVTVVALEAGTTTVIESTTTKTIDGVDGSYAFLGLDKAQNVDIVFTNPNSDDTTRFSPVTSGGSTPTATATHDKATTANITPSAVGFDSVNAGIIDAVEVTFNPNTGTSVTNAINKYPGEAITTEPIATKVGHTFNGWFTAATGGSKVTFPYTVGTTDVTLYAQYTANKYVLSYDVATNGGIGTAPADEQVTFDTLATAPADAVKTGYTFTGWYTAATGGTKWNFATSKMPANAVKLYAQFTINSYTMTFDNEGATTTQTVVYDTVATEPTAPSKTGFTFAGWFDAQTGGTKWNFGTDKMPAANKTLYAQYTRNNYTMTFNDQGTTSTQTVAFDALVTEPTTTPTKSGYTFSGWFDAQTGGAQWNFGTDKMPAANKTLYAQFTADDQNITFDANGGTGAPATLVQPTDSSVNLDALTAPTRAGYTFVGWFDASDTQHSGTFTMPVGGLSLKAKWTADDQVISFNTNGGTGVASITAKTDTTVDLDTVSTSKAGYQFDGWFVGTTQYTGVVTVPAGGLALEAHWTALDQTITFDVNGGNTTTQPADIIQVTDSAVNLDAVTAPTWFGHKFLGWKDASGTTYSGTITMPAGGLTLIAEWQDLIADGVWQIEATNFEITFDELEAFIANGTLEDEILARSNAKAWNDATTEVLTPLTVANISTVQLNPAVGDFIMTIKHEEATTASAFTLNSTNSVLATDITMTVTDTTTAPALPVTGQNQLELISVGALIVLGSGYLFYRRKKK